MRVTTLGCGTSSGVPRIGNDWGKCDPANPRNARLRPSILVEADGYRLLVDTTPDLRTQLLAAEVGVIDAVIWTHEHADHCHGIDDLRQVMHRLGHPVPGYASEAVLDRLVPRFSYAFETQLGYPASIEPIVLQDSQRIGPFEVQSVAMRHGPGWSTGLRIDHGRGSLAYATDWSTLSADMIRCFDRADLFITDALRRRPHPSHAHLGLALEAIAAVRPARARLTHMDNSMDYDTLCRELPATVEPAFDGMVIEIAP